MNFFFFPTQAMVDESYDISTSVDGEGGIHGYIFIAVGSVQGRDDEKFEVFPPSKGLQICSLQIASWMIQRFSVFFHNFVPLQKIFDLKKKD